MRLSERANNNRRSGICAETILRNVMHQPLRIIVLHWRYWGLPLSPRSLGAQVEGGADQGIPLVRANAVFSLPIAQPLNGRGGVLVFMRGALIEQLRQRRLWRYWASSLHGGVSFE
jgi:hypothetical protein